MAGPLHFSCRRGAREQSASWASDVASEMCRVGRNLDANSMTLSPGASLCFSPQPGRREGKGREVPSGSRQAEKGLRKSHNHGPATPLGSCSSVAVAGDLARAQPSFLVPAFFRLGVLQTKQKQKTKQKL